MSDVQTPVQTDEQPPPESEPKPVRYASDSGWKMASGGALQFTATVTHEAYVDLPALIKEFHREYLEVDLRGGYQEWERPVVFLTEVADNMLDEGGGFGGRHFHFSHSDVSWDDGPKWTEADFAKLVIDCPEADAEVYGPPTEEEIAERKAREPTPHDQPLFYDRDIPPQPPLVSLEELR